MSKTVTAQTRVNRHADSLLRLWQYVQDPDPWVNRELRQAYYDALNSMKHNKLIKDFSLKGVIYQDLNTLEASDE